MCSWNMNLNIPLPLPRIKLRSLCRSARYLVTKMTEQFLFSYFLLFFFYYEIQSSETRIWGPQVFTQLIFQQQKCIYTSLIAQVTQKTSVHLWRLAKYFWSVWWGRKCEPNNYVYMSRWPVGRGKLRVRFDPGGLSGINWSLSEAFVVLFGILCWWIWGTF